MDIRRHINENAIYRVVNAGILTAMGLIGLSRLFGIAALTGLHIMTAFMVIAVFAGGNFLKGKTKILYLSTLFICLCVAAAVVGLQTCLTFLESYFQWIMGNGLTDSGVLQEVRSVANEVLQGNWLIGFELVQTIIITAICYLLQILIEKFPVLKTGLACLLLAGLLVCLFAEVVLEHLSVVFLLFYIVMTYVEWIQEHWEKAKRNSVKKQIIWLSPFLAIYLLLMAAMPVPQKPYDWQWAKDIYSKLKESFVEITQNIARGGREDFGTALSGFSEEGRIGNGFREDSREVMTLSVQVVNSLATNMYLTGRVYDTFDGRQWLKAYQDDSKERYIDTMETLYAVRRFDEEKYLRDYLYETRVKIRYEYFNTAYVFAPLKTKSIQSSEGNFKFSFENGALQMEKKRGYGTEYEVRYFQLNQGQELFGQLLEAEKEPDESIWIAIAKEYAYQMGGRVSLETLEKYRQKIYDNYLNQITLSREVENYLAEITKDAESDIEKLKAIEKELASFQYTGTPGALPDWVTDEGKFLDYFLLESRQGYCTYFATVFALLARAEGFPTRYVQGYCVPMQGNREVVVYSDMAHSWPEVYIDDVGWIPFEPTPGYGGWRYAFWNIGERSGESAPAGNKVAGVILGEETEESDEELNKEEKEAEEVPVEEETENKADNVFLKLLCFGIPAVLAGCAAILVLDNVLGIYRYRKMGSEGKLKQEVHWNLRILSWLGLARGEQETLQELKERGKLLPGLPPLVFIENYENIVYGDKSVGKDMIEEARKEREQLLELLKEKKMWVYLYYRMRLHFW